MKVNRRVVFLIVALVLLAVALMLPAAALAKPATGPIAYLVHTYEGYVLYDDAGYNASNPPDITPWFTTTARDNPDYYGGYARSPRVGDTMTLRTAWLTYAQGLAQSYREADQIELWVEGPRGFSNIVLIDQKDVQRYWEAPVLFTEDGSWAFNPHIAAGMWYVQWLYTFTLTEPGTYTVHASEDWTHPTEDLSFLPNINGKWMPGNSGLEDTYFRFTIAK
jgi:hypothetical protein